MNIRIWAYGLLFCMSTLPVCASLAAGPPLIPQTPSPTSSRSSSRATVRRASCASLTDAGYSTALSQILSAPPYVAALIWGAIISALSDRTKHRGGFICLNALMVRTRCLDRR